MLGAGGVAHEMAVKLTNACLPRATMQWDLGVSGLPRWAPGWRVWGGTWACVAVFLFWLAEDARHVRWAQARVSLLSFLFFQHRVPPLIPHFSSFYSHEKRRGQVSFVSIARCWAGSTKGVSEVLKVTAGIHSGTEASISTSAHRVTIYLPPEAIYQYSIDSIIALLGVSK